MLIFAAKNHLVNQVYHCMKEKLFKLLQVKCKDMGLTEEALKDLAEQGSTNLKDDSKDEDITKVADSLVPFAKLMQGEITRKTNPKNPKPSEHKPSDTEGNEEGGKDGDDKNPPAWFAPFAEKLNSLQKENEDLKAQKNKTERGKLIADKAKKLGIDEEALKYFSVSDDADDKAIDTALNGYKQMLVNHGLPSKGGEGVLGIKTDNIAEMANAYVDNLPDSK